MTRGLIHLAQPLCLLCITKEFPYDVTFNGNLVRKANHNVDMYNTILDDALEIFGNPKLKLFLPSVLEGGGECKTTQFKGHIIRDIRTYKSILRYIN